MDNWNQYNESEYTVNGVTYRNLEAQVRRNQEASLEAVATANYAESIASGIAGTANQALNVANNANETATSANVTAQLALVDADTAQQTANNAMSMVNTLSENTVKTISQTLTDEQKSTARNNIDSPKTSGYYPNFDGGKANGISNDIPVSYTKRNTGYPAEVSGEYATIKTIKGNTIVWNQLVNKDTIGDSLTTYGVTYTNNGDGTVTVTGTANATSQFNCAILALVVGHKYLIYGAESTIGARLRLSDGVSFYDAYADGLIVTAQGTDGTLRIRVPNGVTVSNEVFCPQLFDLTKMFGAGNEPSTVAEFKSLYPGEYYDYNPEKLLPYKGNFINTTGEGGASLDFLGIPIFDYFPNGMRSVGMVYDELTASKAITRIGSRAHQSGDEDDSTVITDGTTTYYVLETPTEVSISTNINLTYKMSNLGTEKIEGFYFPPSYPSTAPCVMIVSYAVNQYVHDASFDNFVNAISEFLSIVITKTWNSESNSYEYTIA